MTEKPNLQYIHKLSDGDILFEQKLFSIIKREFVKERDTFNLAFQDKDYERASNVVHKLKHKISLLGLPGGYSIAEDFEIQLKHKDVQLYERFVEILNKIEKFVDEL